MNQPHLIILYDAQCALCQAARRWLERRAIAGTLEFVDCRSEARAQKAPMVAEQACIEAMNVVGPEGEVCAGADAMPLLLSVIPRWRWLGRALGWPLFRHLARPMYRAIARRRLSLSVFFPKTSGDSCGPDDQCS
jgi:predicted DCC family thiol-disulfide oxidoreductase YuxK